MSAVVRRRNALVATSPETASLLDLQASATSVGVFGLGIPETTLVASVMRVRASRAAADAEHPEQRRGPGEGDGQPGDGEGLVAKGELDAVIFEGFVECADEDREEDGGGQNCGDVEE